MLSSLRQDLRIFACGRLPGQVSLTRVWLTVSSLLLSFVFVFGNSIRSIYESVVYLFVVRPFDVGDAILLGAAQDWCTVGPLFTVHIMSHAHLAWTCVGVRIPVF